MQTATQSVEFIAMINEESRIEPGRFDWTRAIIVGGAAAVFLAVSAFAVAPQLVGSLAGAKTHPGSGLHKSGLSSVPKSTTTTTTPTTATTQSQTPPSETPSQYPQPPGSVSPPATIAANCSSDVTVALRQWFKALPPGAVVYDAPGTCYLISEGLNFYKPKGLTIDGGTFEEQGWGVLSRIAFNVIGGTNVTFENLQILGPAIKHVYNREVEFQGGIELQGTLNAVISHVAIFDMRGDGITLVPLRAFQVGNLGGGGEMIRPVENLTISSVLINGTGRMGISLAAVNGATITNVDIRNVATDDFDFEADQSTEGAENVTIDGCTVGGGGALFVSNQGNGAGKYTGNILVENCTMLNRQAGTAILVEDIPNSGTPRGPFTFTDDNIWCGNSAFVSCLLVTRGDIVMNNSTLKFEWTPPEPVYRVITGSTVVFNNVDASNFSERGEIQHGSTVTINGGSWKPSGPR